MCGIIGSFSVNSSTPTGFGLAMEELNHRGPDDSGMEKFCIDNCVVNLGHKRLSIIDLSSSGRQPMKSKDGRFTLVFNGEIYNYRELRCTLEKLGYEFKTDTDTEVLLQCWNHWGSDTPSLIQGMYAFVVFDNSQKRMFCYRDPFGIKPLYYYFNNEHFIFSSEIPALLKFDVVPRVLDSNTAIRYLVTGRHDDDVTFFQDIYSLKPGCFLDIGVDSYGSPKEKRWYQLDVSKNNRLSFRDATEALRESFLKSVKLQLRSDVPVGAALSGGIDSSAVVCCIRYIEPDMPISTFSYIPSEQTLDESKWIEKVNDYVGAKGHFSKAEKFDGDLLFDFVRTQCEPVKTCSFLAEYSVYKLAKLNGIKVMLDGHGADESICGYNGYPAYRVESLLSEHDYCGAVSFIMNWRKFPGRSNFLSGKSFFEGAFRWMNLEPDKLYNKIKRYSSGKIGLIRNEFQDPSSGDLDFDAGARRKGRALVEKLRQDLTGFSCPPQLRSADRSAMRRSIENRVPFLDTDFVKLAMELPESFLVSKQGLTKYIFREAMKDIVPDEILSRKDKIGYATQRNIPVKLSADQADILREGIRKTRFLDYENAIKLLSLGDANQINLTDQSWRVFNLALFIETFDVTEN